MTSVDEFNRIIESDHFTTPQDLGDTLTLDTTHLSAAQSAERIVSHWHHQRGAPPNLHSPGSS